MILYLQAQAFGNDLWELVKWSVPTILSLTALWVALKDRRPKLILRARRGSWYVLRKLNTVRGSEIQFAGTVEVYNESARANAIHSYNFSCKSPNGDWKQMDSERYESKEPDGTGPFVYNRTPLTVGPYSGEEWRVMAFLSSKDQPYELQIRVEVTDLFGKKSSVVVTAYS